jgi:hypothetical protein
MGDVVIKFLNIMQFVKSNKQQLIVTVFPGSNG